MKRDRGYKVRCVLKIFCLFVPFKIVSRNKQREIGKFFNIFCLYMFALTLECISQKPAFINVFYLLDQRRQVHSFWSNTLHINQGKYLFQPFIFHNLFFLLLNSLDSSRRLGSWASSSCRTFRLDLRERLSFRVHIVNQFLRLHRRRLFTFH